MDAVVCGSRTSKSAALRLESASSRVMLIRSACSKLRKASRLVKDEMKKAKGSMRAMQRHAVHTSETRRGEEVSG